MAKTYKVWVTVTEHDDSVRERRSDYKYERIVELDLPFTSARTFDNEHDARAFADLLQDAAEDIEFKHCDCGDPDGLYEEPEVRECHCERNDSGCPDCYPGYPQS